MNQIAEEMRAILEYNDDDALMHIGMPRRSGRYPWGSGEDPYQHSMDFIGRVKELRKEGKSDTEIAKEMGIVNHRGEPSLSKFRDQYSVARHERDLYN